MMIEDEEEVSLVAFLVVVSYCSGWRGAINSFGDAYRMQRLLIQIKFYDRRSGRFDLSKK